jgi:cobyrinic acid a,c-diamide synthase
MKKLVRFGYAELSADKDSLLLAKGDTVRGHEFHHWDADLPGNDLTGKKTSGRSWQCAYATDTLYAGYPHLYFRSNPGMTRRFIVRCHERRLRREHGK